MVKKDDYTRNFLTAAGIEPSTDIIKEKIVEWWYNIRSKDSGGLRLTEQGIDFAVNDAKLKSYTVKFPGKFTITPQILVWLDKFIESPYYITKKDITVLTERAAFELYLFSGDVKKMGYSKALNQRLTQD
jgi:hypothetical protein